jgi:hypothetical protein
MMECWMCKADLAEDESQYCTSCELAMMQDILKQLEEQNEKTA